MIEPTPNLGKLLSVHGISPVFMQRAVIVSVLSFVFFLLMLGGFYVRQNIGYFILSTAFLIIYILTMFGWMRHRRSVFAIYEDGFTYKNQTFRWDEIETFAGREESRLVGGDKMNFEIGKKTGEKIVLTEAVADAAKIIEIICEKMDIANGAGNEPLEEEEEE
jgi:hypothetical protein